MKKLFLFLILSTLSVTLAHAEGWGTDYKAALAQAKQEKKLVLLDFTGSDWCGYCKLLDKEVFTNASFKDFVAKSYIPVTIDFPHNTTLPEALTKQNDELQQKFNIDGFPTLIVVNPDGKEISRIVGYDPGSGAKAVMDRLTAKK